MHIFYTCFLSYLIGSIPIGWIIGRVKGINILILSEGIGATNTAMAIGYQWFIPVAILDVVKGYLVVKMNYLILHQDIAILISLLAVIGHRKSIFLKFRGDCGFAAIHGVLFASSAWLIVVIFDVIWAVCFLLRLDRRTCVCVGTTVFIVAIAVFPGIQVYTKITCIICALYSILLRVYGKLNKKTDKKHEEIIDKVLGDIRKFIFKTS